MDPIACMIVLAFVSPAVGLATGGLLDALWRGVHGPDRTPEAARLLAFGILGELLTVALAVGLVLPLFASAAAVASAIVTGFVAGAILLVPPGRSGPEVVEPPDTRHDHDGVAFTVRWRPAGVSALLVLLAIAVPFPMGFAAVAWSRWGQALRVRIRAGEIEAVGPDGGERLPLHGALLDAGVRSDGTPYLELSTMHGPLRIPLGGLPTGERAWIRATLERAIAESRPLPGSREPVALRQLIRRTVAQ